MNEKKVWQTAASALKEVLQLDCSPVGIAALKEVPPDTSGNKVRICRAFLQAAKGETLQIGRANNACFGAAWPINSAIHRTNANTS